ncbi:LysM peptidoglycan-binding domain-containing protein [Tetragenococcus solitarius]|uniref:LysM domain-containing protein n=1 Tax=Tetragenococcus solitarius TaxID=71453 RepID=A0ABN3Y2E4_9ENTE|nr:LysM peptidoglycan-binding domain-containing protein [Tetragenococcus solitarius]
MKLKKLLLGTALAAGTVFAVGTTSANADEIYTIQSNDTLAKISTKYTGDKSLIDSIVEANDIKDKNMIYVGEELTIPTDGDSKQAPAQQEAPVQEQQAPVQEAPVQEQQPAEQEPAQTEQEPAQAEQQPAQEADTSNDSSSVEVNDHLKQIAQRESGGDIHATNPTSGASGKYQFLQSTWDSVAPAEYQGSPAANAPEEVQDAAAQKLYDTAGPSQWVTA